MQQETGQEQPRPAPSKIVTIIQSVGGSRANPDPGRPVSYGPGGLRSSSVGHGTMEGLSASEPKVLTRSAEAGDINPAPTKEVKPTIVEEESDVDQHVGMQSNWGAFSGLSAYAQVQEEMQRQQSLITPGWVAQAAGLMLRNQSAWEYPEAGVGSQQCG